MTSINVDGMHNQIYSHLKKKQKTKKTTTLYMYLYCGKYLIILGWHLKSSEWQESCTWNFVVVPTGCASAASELLRDGTTRTALPLQPRGQQFCDRAALCTCLYCHCFGLSSELRFLLETLLHGAIYAADVCSDTKQPFKRRHVFSQPT